MVDLRCVCAMVDFRRACAMVDFRDVRMLWLIGDRCLTPSQPGRLYQGELERCVLWLMCACCG